MHVPYYFRLLIYHLSQISTCVEKSHSSLFLFVVGQLISPIDNFTQLHGRSVKDSQRVQELEFACLIESKFTKAGKFAKKPIKLKNLIHRVKLISY